MNLKEKLKNGMEKTALADYAKYIPYQKFRIFKMNINVHVINLFFIYICYLV